MIRLKPLLGATPPLRQQLHRQPTLFRPGLPINPRIFISTIRFNSNLPPPPPHQESPKSSTPNNGSSQSGSNQDKTYGEKLKQAAKTPTKWYPIPIALGAIVLLAVQFRKQIMGGPGSDGLVVTSQGEKGAVVKSRNVDGPWQVRVMGALPLRSASQLWGYLNSLVLPVWFRPTGFKVYGWIFGCDMSEVPLPLTSYESLGEFFYREIDPKLRPIADAPMVSPADGRVLHYGQIVGNRVEQVKGITYSLGALLGKEGDEVEPKSEIQRKTNAKVQMVDDENFASINDIPYSIDKLMGSGRATKEEKAERKRKWGWVKTIGTWRPWKTKKKVDESGNVVGVIGNGEGGGEGKVEGQRSWYNFWSKRTSATKGEEFKGEGPNTAAIPPSVQSSSSSTEDSVQPKKSWSSYIWGSSTSKPTTLSSTSSIKSASEEDEADDDDETNTSDGAIEHDASHPMDKETDMTHDASVALSLGSKSFTPVTEKGQDISLTNPQSHQLYFIVVYLAPGDYHRFHSPTSWVVERRRHFTGDLFSVSPYIANRLQNLFVLNERVALLGRWKYGFFSMVPVGATNVGSIRINFDENLRTNTRNLSHPAHTFTEAVYTSASKILQGQPLVSGEEIGGFRLGSTIVMVFEGPKNWKWSVKAGELVKVGQALGRFED